MKYHDGGKHRGTHTTLIELAARVIDIIVKLPEVTGYSPGYLQAGKGLAGGTQRVKISSFEGGLVLTIRQSRSVQEVRVYSANLQAAKLAIARKLRDHEVPISFQHS